MRPIDFLTLCLCCLIWGGNFVLSKWMLTDLTLPPFFFAFARFSLVVVLMAPFLFPLPKKFGLLCLAALCVGAGHLAFLYTGLRTAPASSGAIVGQMLIPFATLLSVIFLKEKIGWKRAAGITGALIGVVILLYDPSSLSFDIGLIYVMLAFLLMAIGSIVIKGVGAVGQFKYLAWMGVLALPVLGLSSFLFESNQIELAKAANWKLGVGMIYTAIGSSIFAHGQYFRLIKSYDVSLIVPLTLMTPFWAVMLGALIRNEPLNPRFVLGASLILVSVYIIARRQKSLQVEE
ncbi:MAG: DMT family transporter [Acidimicrobiales bacterium]|nr:DMT family transporter [Hyphomonadaceae bacterium]RZV43065.1 MAG: DMT family transporter [Acidimicrobiales bacterium]